VSRARVLALVAAFCATAACGPGEGVEPRLRAGYGEPFTLGLGESAEVGGRALVRFARVSEDSRCPEGVQCVQAGNAAAAFSVESERGSATLTLHTDREPRGAAAMGVELSVVELHPRPVAGAPTDSAAYRATLVAESAP